VLATCHLSDKLYSNITKAKALLEVKQNMVQKNAKCAKKIQTYLPNLST